MVLVVRRPSPSNRARTRRICKAKYTQPCHDGIVMPLGKVPASKYPIIYQRIVFIQQPLELMKFYTGKLRETLIRKTADQRIGLARPAVPSAES